MMEAGARPAVSWQMLLARVPSRPGCALLAPAAGSGACRLTGRGRAGSCAAPRGGFGEKTEHKEKQAHILGM